MHRSTTRFGGNSYSTGSMSYEPGGGEGYCNESTLFGLFVDISKEGELKGSTSQFYREKECSEEDCKPPTYIFEVTKPFVSKIEVPAPDRACEILEELIEADGDPDLGSLAFLVTDALDSLRKNGEGSGADQLNDIVKSLCSSSTDTSAASFDIFIQCCENDGTCNQNSDPSDCSGRELIDLFIDPTEALDAATAGAANLGSIFSEDLEEAVGDISIPGKTMTVPSQLVSKICCFIGCPEIELNVDDHLTAWWNEDECSVQNGFYSDECEQYSMYNEAGLKLRTECAIKEAMKCWIDKQEDCWSRKCPGEDMDLDDLLDGLELPI